MLEMVSVQLSNISSLLSLFLVLTPEGNIWLCCTVFTMKSTSACLKPNSAWDELNNMQKLSIKVFKAEI